MHFLRAKLINQTCLPYPFVDHVRGDPVTGPEGQVIGSLGLTYPINKYLSLCNSNGCQNKMTKKNASWYSIIISEHASTMFIRISTCSPSLCFLGPSRWLRGVLFHGLEIGKFHRLVRKSGKNATIYQAYFIHAGTGTLSFYKPIKKNFQCIILHFCDVSERISRICK